NQAISYYGGAIYHLYGGDLEIGYSEFVNNVANIGGAITSLDDDDISTLTIFGSSFENNTGVAQGGAIYMQNIQLIIQNCLFKNNFAIQGGSIYRINGFT